MTSPIKSAVSCDLTKVVSWSDFQSQLHQIYDDLCMQAQNIHPILADISYKKGKAIRAQLIFFIAELLGAVQSDHQTLACTIEYLHWASLLHDDVLDQGQIRRESPCMHKRYGNTLAILGGDWYVAQAFSVLLTLDREVIYTVQGVMKPLVQGQMMDCSLQPDVSPEHYLTMIGYKTAALFSVAAKASAMLSGARDDAICALEKFGQDMGMAYQLQDDAAEYAKPVEFWDLGHDFFQNKVTLPWIVTRQYVSIKEWNQILDIQKTLFSESPMGGMMSVERLALLSHIQQCFQGGVQSANNLAKEYKEHAVQAIQACWSKEESENLLHWGSF